MNNQKFILGISFLLFGVLSFLSGMNYLSLSIETVMGITFIAYSLPTVFVALNSGRRDKLVSGTILFLIGVVYLVRFNFEILSSRGIVFVSILFITGSVFLILFIENSKERIFLASAALLISLSCLTTALSSRFGIFNAANRVGSFLEFFWPVILIIFGIVLFSNRDK